MKRVISWLMGVLAYAIPPASVVHAQAALSREAEAQGGAVCGLPALAMVGVAAVLAVVFSGLALLFGWLALGSLAAPRPSARTLELVFLAIPMVLWLGYAALLYGGG